jgi:peptide chain release factor 2
VAPFNLAGLKNELAELEQDMAEPGFWNDLAKSARVSQRAKNVSDRIDGYAALIRRCDDIASMIELVDEENDSSMVDEIKSDIAALNKDAQALRLETLLRGEYDRNDAILSLHAGAGGTEAQDWAGMLYRMYTRYCERTGFTVKLLDLQDGDEAGLKSVTWSVSGQNAYGFLRAEKGVHRLVRISPFDSSARRHTSFASLDVAPVIEDAAFELDMEEVRIDTYRASGAGGQHVNRTDSAVRMTHIPTGIVVQCQNERSQVQNRDVCLMMLKSRILELREREKEERMSDIKGEMKKIEWGSQIRSYVFHPYSMVKDHRTNFEVSSTTGVMDGELDGFITAYLQMQ